uniref:Macaca fascicularis brain cDNA clone: QflA-18545, similar to human proteasome (prosome, macropain) subunit, alpha type, 5(PSMA5), mRNA, RefSeq: NM_002790.2 n=1 Tax=Macaca fascicularis TaxID=9541 RepID=I7GLK0_MACFA|nr:unnamed protein product [Macaca fascicularis]
MHMRNLEDFDFPSLLLKSFLCSLTNNSQVNVPSASLLPVPSFVQVPIFPLPCIFSEAS